MNSKKFTILSLLNDGPPVLERQEPQDNGLSMAQQPIIATTILPNVTPPPSKIVQIGHGRKKTKAKVYKVSSSTGNANVPLEFVTGKIKQKLDVEQFQGRHFKCLDANEASSGHYKGYRFLGNFELSDKAPYPENDLCNLFHMALNQAILGAAQNQLKPNYHIFLINSRILDYDITVNLHEINETTIDAILNKFEKHDQSNRAKDRPSIISEPFQIDVTSIELKTTNKRKRKHPGAAQGRRKIRLKPIHFEINQNAIHEINNNDDRFCLFRAITWILKKKTMDRRRFHEFKADEAAQLNTVLDLLNATGIDQNRLFYDIEDYGEKIQEYIDQQYPNKFKIFAFENAGKFRRPFWKSSKEYFDEPLCIFYWAETGHYDPIKSIRNLWHEESKYDYCFACEAPFQVGYKHTSRCKAKCKCCTQVGPKHPCQPTDFKQFCAGCSKLFTNKESYLYHINKGICEKSKKCPECNIVYRTDHMNNYTGHKCGEKFCRRCLGYHEKRSCYIRPFEKKKQPKDERIIIMDSESTTHFQPDPNVMKFAHQTNYVWAIVTCTRCVAKGKWNKPLDQSPCKICGDHRTYCWAPFDFEGKEVDVFTLTADPMGDFVDWVIHFEDVGGNDELAKNMGIAGEEVHEIGDDSSEPEFSGEEDFDENLEDGRSEHSEEIGFCEEELIIQNEELTEDERNRRWLQEYWLNNGEFDSDETNSSTKKEPKEQVRFRNLVYAHAGSKYDNIFCFGKILEKERIAPKLIRSGNRLYEMKVEGKGLTKTIFRDSYHIIPIKLAKFVDTFGLDIQTKKFFPHHYNRPENYNITINKLPPIDDYAPGCMHPEEREELLKWYEENKNTEFNLNDALAEYCSHDVELLATGLIQMQKLLFDVTGQNIMHSVTLSSACMKVFRAQLPKNHLALTPHMGYEKHGTQSVKGRKFLKVWKKVKVRSAESQEGELRYKNYVLDGYVERPEDEKDLVIEVNGCYWHACPSCYPDDDTVLANGIPAGKIRERNAERMETLLEEFDVKVYWECQIDDMLQSQKIIQVKRDGSLETITMQSFFDNLPDTGLIHLGDAFYGGRTGPEALIATIRGKPNKKIKYKDFKSLYPTMNWQTKYPIGHPKIKEFYKNVDWKDPLDIRDENGGIMEGIIKCFVVPPRHPLHGIPVLPKRVENSLVFPLCSTCAKKMKGRKKRLPTYQCKHFTDEERGFDTTITTMELGMALNAGYRVTKLYRAYDWEKLSDWDQQLFHPYMKKFMKLKYEAEGWPKHCTEEGISEEEKERRKKQHVDTANDRFGFGLKAEDIKFNPGLRYLAKQALNCLWGRFALRNRLSISVIVNNEADLAHYLFNPKIDINVCEPLDNTNWLICYKTKDEHIREHDSSNVVVALWTTSAARIHLLNHLYAVKEGRTDTEIIYMDTDSIIYEFDDRLGDPLEQYTADQMGWLADEYPSHEIQEIVMTAPKAYAIWMKDIKTGEDKYVWRLKGLPMTSDVKNQLRYERYREMAIQFGTVPEEEVTETFTLKKNFRIELNGQINTVHMNKRLRPVVNKGIVRSALKIVPFGFSDKSWCRVNNPNDCSCKN